VRLCRQQLNASDISPLVKAFMQNSSITHIDLACNNIRDEGAIAIADGIGTVSHLMYLDVGWNDIGQRGAAALAAAIELRTASSAFELIMSGNDIGCEGAALFTNAAKRGQLHTLKIAFTHDGSSRGHGVYSLFNSQLSVLSLASNKLKGEGISQFITASSANASLRQLELQNNMLGASAVKQLASALTSMPYLDVLNLSRNHLGEDASDAIEQLLMNDNHLKTINISGCCLGRKACQSIARVISQNAQLQLCRLNIGSNSLCNHGLNYDGINDLTKALHAKTSIRELILERTQLRTAGCWAVASMLRSVACTLQVLDLSCNEISSTGAKTVAKSLKQNKTLLALSLRSNMVDSAAAVEFSSALEVNTSLLALDLENNDIDDAGLEALLSAIYKTSTLKLLNVIMNEFDPDDARNRMQKLDGAVPHQQANTDGEGDVAACGGRPQVLLNNHERVELGQAIRGMHMHTSQY